jgi:uncharacterized UPF0146 family protein
VPASRTELVARLAVYDHLVEVGIGRRPEVAAALAADDCEVTATDVFDAPVPDSVRFVRDDVVARAAALAGDGDDASPPDPYDADAIYGLNLPAELQRPAHDVARAAGADFLFTTLGFEEPAIPVDRETVGRETLYVAAPHPR